MEVILRIQTTPDYNDKGEILNFLFTTATVDDRETSWTTLRENDVLTKDI